jgi:putative restriction endonuclease
MVRLWAANTDLDWFDYLAAQPEIDEVNFWQPSGHANFGAIGEGELFLFKLKVRVTLSVASESSANPPTCRFRSRGKHSALRMVRERCRRCATASFSTGPVP